MGTEVAVSFSSLRTQLENEKSSLFKIDENIKKIVQTSGRFNDRFNNSSGDYGRGGPRTGGRNSFPEPAYNFNKNDDINKRKHETKTVFSRLSARGNDSEGEDEGSGIKRARVPSAVSREMPTRAAILRAQGDDAQTRTRNRRMFGSLLGTLQKFKQEEIGLQTKEDKKAQVERKIEEQARLEKEREQQERKTLFAEREHKKATIKALEAKMARVQEFEKWEISQKSLGNFILTKAKPHIYWIPKKMSDKANEKLTSSRNYHEKFLAKKRYELQDELQRIEQRCLRIRGPGMKENDPATNHEDKERKGDHRTMAGSSNTEVKIKEEDGVKKRDKFAMDVDNKDDSEGEEHAIADGMVPKIEKESVQSKLDTHTEQASQNITLDPENNTTMSPEKGTTMDPEKVTTMDLEKNTSMDPEKNTTMETEINTSKGTEELNDVVEQEKTTDPGIVSQLLPIEVYVSSLAPPLPSEAQPSEHS